jgi:hypothetical protein
MTDTTTTQSPDRSVERPRDSRLIAGVALAAWATFGLVAVIVLTGLDAIAYSAYIDPWGWSGFAFCAGATILLATVAVVALLLALAVSG